MPQTKPFKSAVMMMGKDYAILGTKDGLGRRPEESLPQAGLKYHPARTRPRRRGGSRPPVRPTRSSTRRRGGSTTRLGGAQERRRWRTKMSRREEEMDTPPLGNGGQFLDTHFTDPKDIFASFWRTWYGRLWRDLADLEAWRRSSGYGCRTQLEAQTETQGPSNHAGCLVSLETPGGLLRRR